MKRWIHSSADLNNNTARMYGVNAAVSTWKTRYRVHWISPEGEDYLLGGSKSFEEAQDIAKDQAFELFDSPFESNKRKFHFLDSIYIVDTENGNEDAMSYETEEYIDNLMSEIDSKIKRS